MPNRLSSDHRMVCYGEPKPLDFFYRPLARSIVLAISIPICFLLCWFEYWWWVPIPIAIALLGYELFFWWRGDRPCQLALDERALSFSDSFKKESLTIDLGEVTVASLWFREGASGTQDVFISLSAGPEQILALSFAINHGFTPEKEDIDINRMDLLLGGHGNILAAISGESPMCRQRFIDPKGTAFATLRKGIDKEAWGRTSIHLWQGTHPELDPFGFHRGRPSHRLVLDEKGYQIYGDSSSKGVWKPWSHGHGQRQAVLIQRGDEAYFDEVTIPLLTIALGEEVTIAIPAPSLAQPEALDEAQDQWFHTHVPEGSALLWFLRECTPETEWPQTLAIKA